MSRHALPIIVFGGSALAPLVVRDGFLQRGAEALDV
jgi:hypothetical protein